MLRTISFGFFLLLFGVFALFGFLCPLLWVPAFFLLLIMVVMSSFSSLEREIAPGEPTTVSLLSQLAKARTVASREAALKTYLEQADARGMDRDRAVSSLARNGWSEAELRDAVRDMP